MRSKLVVFRPHVFLQMVINFGMPSLILCWILMHVICAQRIIFAFPKNHTRILQSDVAGKGLSIKYHIENFTVGIDGCVKFYHSSKYSNSEDKFVKDRGMIYVHTESDLLKLNNLKIGSFFLCAELWSLDESSKLSSTFTVHYEILPSDNELRLNRHFPNSSIILPTVKHELCSKKRKICMCGSMDHDGQKEIWLAKIDGLAPYGYEFCWITSSSIQEDSYMLNELNKRNIDIFQSSISMPREQAEAYNIRTSAQYTSALLNCKPQYSVHIPNSRHIQLEWPTRNVFDFCKQNWISIVKTLQLTGADVLVMGYTILKEDQLIREAFKYSTISAIVTELTNEYVYDSDSVNITEKVSAVVGPSDATIEKYQLAHQGTPSMNFTVPPGINTAIFAKANTTHQSNNSFFRIGYVGRLDLEKSVAILIDVTKYLKQFIPHIELLIIGGGPQIQVLQSYAKDLQISANVAFLGPVYNKSLLVQHMNTFHVFLTPTLQSETFCIANIEAMALGLPVVGYGVGGIGQYLRHNYNGLLVNSTKVSAFGNQILRLYRDVNLYQTLSSNAMLTVQSVYTTERMLENYRRVYASVISKI